MWSISVKKEETKLQTNGSLWQGSCLRLPKRKERGRLGRSRVILKTTCDSSILSVRSRFYRVDFLNISLTWGYSEVLPMGLIVQIFNRSVWSELFSLSLFSVSPVIANEGEIAFFWPIAHSSMSMRKRATINRQRWGRSKVRLMSMDLRLYTTYTEGLKKPLQ